VWLGMDNLGELCRFTVVAHSARRMLDTTAGCEISSGVHVFLHRPPRPVKTGEYRANRLTDSVDVGTNAGRGGDPDAEHVPGLRPRRLYDDPALVRRNLNRT
jgi:hypothetical protein